MSVTRVLLLGPVVNRPDIPRLCKRLTNSLQDSNTNSIMCDVGALADPDAVAVDALARLQLTAKRCGGEVRLSGACQELRRLLALMGMQDVVQLALEPRWKAEHRKQRGAVEKECDPGDPTFRNLEYL